MTNEANQQSAEGIGVRGLLLLILAVLVAWFALFGVVCFGVIYRANLAALWHAAAALITGTAP